MRQTVFRKESCPGQERYKEDYQLSLQVEKLEKNMAKLTIEVDAEEFSRAVENAYQKNKGKISVPGFRKGKVPRKMIEQMYGKGVFYEDAANEIIPDAYEKAVEECEETIVSSPKIDVTQIEEGKPFIFTAEVALKPEVTLGAYKGIEVEKVDTTVTDEEIEEDLQQQRENNARTVSVEGRPVQNGDIAVIDYEGFVDGVAFEGGKGENHNLTIGSHSFIDTFEEQLIGKNAGESCEVHVTFPEEYHAKELAGKPAVFQVTVKEIKEKQLPELNDEFAGEVSEFETLAEYKDDIRKKLTEKKEEDAKAKKEDDVIQAIIDGAQMDIPEAMVETQQRQLVDDFAQRLQMQGLSMDQYFQFTGMTYDKMMEQVKPQAESRIQSRLVLEAVAAAENIAASEEEYDAEIERMAKMYQLEADKVKEMMGEQGRKQIMEDLAVRKAVEFVVGESKEKSE